MVNASEELWETIILKDSPIVEDIEVDLNLCNIFS